MIIILKNMLEMKKIFYRTVVAVCCGVLPFGCVKEDIASLGEQHNVAVQLNVGTRAVSETDGTPANEESALHSLRVYAFVKGKLVGHEFHDGDMDASASFWMDLAMTSLTTETVDFYLVANEAAMATPGVDAKLTENTSESQLNSYTFTVLNAVGTYGLPMFAKESRTIDFSKLSTDPDRQPTGDHAGHTPIEEKLSFQLKRPVGKLGVFAAKDEGDNGRLQITGLTMLTSGTRARNYLMPQETGVLEGVGNGTGDLTLTPSGAEVTATLGAGITSEERKDPANYTAVLDVPYYPFENPWGSANWAAQGDAGGNVLKIDYSFDGDQRTGMVYLPAIERNKYYTVCCLMHNSGKITVSYGVADWDEGGNYELGFDFPNNELLVPFNVNDGTNPPYAQPTVYYNNDQTSEAGCYSFRFAIKGPEGQDWMPTLFDATAADYILTVYQTIDGTRKVVEPEDYVASEHPYEIQVRARQGANIDKEFSLGIAYTPQWDESGTSLLLINMLSGSTNWTGSESTEKIVIRQVDHP